MHSGISLEGYLDATHDYLVAACPELNIGLTGESFAGDLKRVSVNTPFALIGYSQIVRDEECPDLDGLLGVDIQMYAYVGTKQKKGERESAHLGKLMKAVNMSRFGIDACVRPSRWVQTLTLAQDKSSALIRRVIWRHQFFLDCT